MPKTMSIETAYNLAVKKWEWIVAHNGDNNEDDIIIDLPELEPFVANCSYCELFSDLECKGCPLNIKQIEAESWWVENGCTTPGTEFKRWSDWPTKENAMAVLNLIIQTRPF